MKRCHSAYPGLLPILLFIVSSSISPAVRAREVIRTQDSQVVIEPLNPGEIVAGSILAPSTTPSAASECKLGDTQ